MNEETPILIAEDDDDDFFFFRRAVRATSIDNPILRFRDGAEFVKFAEGLPRLPAREPWLFFVDITMPVMTGFAVLEWLKERRDRLNLRTVVLSVSDRQEDVAKARALGAHDYLVKPLSVADLTRVAADYIHSVPA